MNSEHNSNLIITFWNYRTQMCSKRLVNLVEQGLGQSKAEHLNQDKEQISPNHSITYKFLLCTIIYQFVVGLVT